MPPKPFRRAPCYYRPQQTPLRLSLHNSPNGLVANSWGKFWAARRHVRAKFVANAARSIHSGSALHADAEMSEFIRFHGPTPFGVGPYHFAPVNLPYCTCERRLDLSRFRSPRVELARSLRAAVSSLSEALKRGSNRQSRTSMIVAELSFGRN